MMIFSIFLVASLAFFFSFFLTKWLISFLEKKGMYDIPNQRSSHSKPVPRGGGIAIISGFLGSLLIVKVLYPGISLPGYSFFLGVILLMGIGFVDDKFNISPILRFFVHILAVGFVVYETGGFKAFPLPISFSLGWFSIPISFFWILAVMNIYNFLDGIDGFAGSQALIAGIAVAILDGGGIGTVVGVAIAFSALGFLIFNWHPAKIFMGDVGSVTLGFIFATLPLFLNSTEVYIANFAVIIFLWFFLSDGAFTIIKRLFQKKKIWEAHREHLYQRMVIKGVSHHLIVGEVMFYSIILNSCFLLLYFFAYDWLIISFVLALIMFPVYLYRVQNFNMKGKYEKL